MLTLFLIWVACAIIYNIWDAIDNYSNEKYRDLAQARKSKGIKPCNCGICGSILF